MGPRTLPRALRLRQPRAAPTGGLALGRRARAGGPGEDAAPEREPGGDRTEPTNDLDVSTLGALEQMLVELGATALVVTHDPLVPRPRRHGDPGVRGDGRVASQQLRGFRRSRRARAQHPSTRNRGRSRKPSRPRGPAQKKKALSRAEEKELAGAPDAIERAEQRSERARGKLADPSTYSASGADVPAWSPSSTPRRPRSRA